jgi:hypothetical protein
LKACRVPFADVAAIDLVSDLIELECIAAAEGDDDRRRRLLELRDRLAARAGGALLERALDDAAAGRLIPVRVEDLDELIPGSRRPPSRSR